MAYFYGGSYPLRLENRLYGALNEYAELNDVAVKNNMIYTQNMMGNCKPRGCHGYVPSLYSYPYYRPPYYNPYLYGSGYGYGAGYGYGLGYGYGPLINPYLY